MQVASAPDNSVDIHADLIATGKMWWKPACSTFESMGKMNSMPVELEPYLTRPDYAEKFEKFNELIKMEADNLKRRKKTCVFSSCPLAIFLPCWIFGTMAVHQKQLGKMVDRLEYHAKTVFADWKRQGIDIVFIPGKSGDGEGAGQMFDVPNTIRILYPRSAVEEKFGEQPFRVFSEMRGKKLYIDAKK